MEEQKPRVAIVGFGNLLLKDEGVGIHVIKALQAMVWPRDGGIEIIDGGTSTDILSGLTVLDKLVIVDAAAGGGEAGSVYRFGPEEVAEQEMVTSLHQNSLSMSLKTMKYVGLEPKEVVIIGVEPAEIDWGLKLSLSIQNKLPRIVEIVLREAGIVPQNLQTIGS
ncbi:MAG: hydrogenase maturation protease [Dehalococcoidales bacterium]|nr:hydrogenase maturation protease [Dehalococcoidales bacterium]